MEFTLNGNVGLGGAGREHEPARAPARRARGAVGQGRLRPGGLLRRLHGDGRRPGGRLLRAEGDAVRGQARRHPRGPLRGGAASLERVLRRRRRLAVRLLLARHRDEGRGAPAQASGADPGRDRARPARQPLPLHRLRQDHRRDRARGRRAARASRSPSPTAAAASARARPATSGTELALGDNVFVGDMTAPGMLHGALRFSDHPRARDPPDRHVEGARGARRRGRPHGRRRARRSACRARSSATGASSSPRARSPRTSAT